MNTFSILQCRVAAPARQPLLAGVLVVAALWGRADAEVRAWTNTAGQTFQAELVRVDGANVIFAFNDGRTFSTPLSSLSASDQALVRQAAAAQPAPVRPPNFGYPWPREIRVDGSSQSKVVSGDAKTGVYVYESPHYRFTCNVRLTSDVLRNFAMMFETTRKYVTTVPLGLDGGAVRHGKLDVQLFETMEAYVRGGGGPGTAACYITARGVVLAPLESLGLLKTSTGFSLDMKRTNAVLIHELTHQLTPLAYMVATLGNGWFIEGMAEYIASSPYSWGYFRSDPHGNAVLAYVTAYGEDRKGGRVLGKKLRVPRLRQLMQMEYRHFAGANANLHYGAGLLLTHYFLHMEGGGKAMRITEYLKGLRAGRTGEAAIAPLLGGGSFEKLEADFAEAWRKKGLEIAFE
jgi:hypothetical protein